MHGTPPSSRVRLEVDFLDAERAADTPAPSAHDERTRLTVLLVAAEVDIRLYLRECLRERTEVRIIEAATISTAVSLAAAERPDLLIVDAEEPDVISALPDIGAVVIVDDVPPDVPPDVPSARSRLRFLARPFTAERLMTEVGYLLS